MYLEKNVKKKIVYIFDEVVCGFRYLDKSVKEILVLIQIYQLFKGNSEWYAISALVGKKIS